MPLSLPGWLFSNLLYPRVELGVGNRHQIEPILATHGPLRKYARPARRRLWQRAGNLRETLRPGSLIPDSGVRKRKEGFCNG